MNSLPSDEGAATNLKNLKKLEKSVAFFNIRDTIKGGGIAQLGEYMHHTHGVAGSSPVVSIPYAITGD